MTISEVMAAAGFAPTDYEEQRFYYHGIPLTEWVGVYLWRAEPAYVDPKLPALLYHGWDVEIVLRQHLSPLYVLLPPEGQERTRGTLRIRDE
jgi:hypothetical protein